MKPDRGPHVWVVTLAACVAIVIAGCGGGEEPAGDYERFSPDLEEQLARWWVPTEIERPDGNDRPYELRPDATSIRIVVDPDYCWPRPESPVERLDVEETTEAVTITAWVRPKRGEFQTACNSLHPEIVELDAPLGDRTLLVGGLGSTPDEAEVRRP